MAKFRKKSITVEAFQFTVDNWKALEAWSKDRVKAVGWRSANDVLCMSMDTKEGTMYAMPNDWIIKEPFATRDRQFYPCKPDIFEATYEPA